MRKLTNRHTEQEEKDQVGEMTDDLKGISPVDVMMNESINATGHTNKLLPNFALISQPRLSLWLILAHEITTHDVRFHR